MKKYFKQKLFRIKFPKKNSVEAYLYLPQEEARGLQKWPFLKYNMQEWESKFTLELTTAKNTDYIKNLWRRKCDISKRKS